MKLESTSEYRGNYESKEIFLNKSYKTGIDFRDRLVSKINKQGQVEYLSGKLTETLITAFIFVLLGSKRARPGYCKGKLVGSVRD